MSGRALSREQKIEMFKLERQLAKSIDAGFRGAGSGKGEDGEEMEDMEEMEEMRPVYLMLVNHFALKACSALRLLRQEVEMLVSVAAMSEDERMKATRRDSSEAQRQVMEKLRDAVRGLSMDNKKEQMRADVFRPSHVLPTMTVEAFGEMEVARMQREEEEKAMEAERARCRREMSLNLPAEREAEEEAELHKARAWDDFRDAHKRGSGNSKLRNTR